MRRLVLATVWGLCVVGAALSQSPRPGPDEPPPPAPPPADTTRGPLSPAEAAKQRDAAIKELKEDLRTFDPSAVTAEQAGGRWQVRAGTEMLKDFGTDRDAALEAARVVRELRVNQHGTVPGARPAFDYWLVDGKAPRAVNGKVVVLPVSARTVRAEQAGGTWVVTDGLKGLYDFGANAEAAKQAATVFAKYGFNQVGVIGSPQPVMLYPLLDPRQAALDRAAPAPAPMPLAVLSDAARTSLLLPGNVNAGPRTPIDSAKLEVGRRDRDYVLTHKGDVLARFGGSELTAKAALKALQDAHVTEVVRVGEGGFPLFLADGLPIHAYPLGVEKVALRPDRLKVQRVRDAWWLFEDTRPVLEAGTKADAELMLRVLRHFDLKGMCVFGRPEAGGLRLLTVGR